MNNNELRKFQCANCRKSKLVLKKVANQQHHGFACEVCWAAIETRPRYGLGGKCSMQ
jgi:transcription elongation factor Elf1